MARTSNITFGQVAAIADAMKAAGNRPTARAVRERIGSGSMGTIHKLLQQWQGKAEADEDEESAELPMHIQNALMDFIGTEIATACEPINDELQAAKDATEAIALDNERMYLHNENIANELEQCRQERAAAMAQLNETRDQLKAGQKQWEALGRDNTALLRDLDRAQRQIEMLASLAQELSITEATLAEYVAKRQEAEKLAAVLDAKLYAAIDKAETLSDRLNAADERAANFERAAKFNETALAKCSAELSAVTRELIDNKEKLAKPVKSPAKKTTAKKPVNQELAV